MERSCERCGATFTAKHTRARFCGDACRQAAHRASVTVVDAAPPEVTGGPVEAATAAELTGAGRVGSPLGQAALVLARRLDGGGSESGAALAALARQLRETLAAATAGAQKAADPLDELRTRRDRKRVAG